MEPLRLLFGLLFAVMSVGVLIFPVSWPFSKDDKAAIPTPALASDTSQPETVETDTRDTSKSSVKLADIPTDTVLSMRPAIPSKDLTDQLSIAKYLAAEKQFDEALELLSELPTDSQDHYEVVFLRARILSWAGRHLAAEQKFHRLMAKYPTDTDLMVSYGYLQYYQGKLAAAEKAFIGVLDINPDYTDAKDGLAKARKAM